jgi:hypothetical protein
LGLGRFKKEQLKMDLINSKNINNRIKKRTIFVAIIAHIILAILTFGISLIFLAIAGIVTKLLLKKDIDKAKSRNESFNKNYPFGYFGRTLGSFQHVFHHSYSIEKDIYSAIEEELKSKTPIKSVKSIAIIDTDSDLKNCEQRSFIKAESEPTSRGTTITLLLNQSNFGSIRTIQWRVLAGGYVDKNSEFNLIAYSLFTLLYWIGPYLRGEADVLGRVRAVYTSAYNDMDVATQVRCLHEVVFDAMIAELKKNGIDTSELKLQKMQVANMNISGGKVNVGNLVQGERA